MTSANEVLRRLLNERGVEYMEDHGYREFFWDFGESGRARASAIGTKGLVQMIVTGITPEQAIAATLGNEGVARSNDGVAELGAGTCRRVYLVEVSDDLIESWCPLSVYLHREAAEDCAEALRKEEGGIRQFARVSELKVVDDG